MGDSALSSSAAAFRAAFGDRKPPDISRKITACVACRKLKIKCHMTNAQPPCDRCKKRGLSCTVNKSLQMILEHDLSWKDSVEERLAHLESIVLSQGTPAQVLESSFSENKRLQPASSIAQHANDSSTDEAQQGWEVVVDENSAPAAIPASCVSEVSSPPLSRQTFSATDTSRDLILQGTVDCQTARSLFDTYHSRLDHFLYSILKNYHSLEDVRQASPLLTGAVCVVAALHSKQQNYGACRTAFVQQVSSIVLSKKHTAADVKGLCIGAFWLSDLSWALVGTAVRIALEINLHRSFIRPDYASRTWYSRARLYLLVYVCDHHFSIVYGRPPMTEEFSSLNFAQDFLNSPHASEDDARLFSQVEMWTIAYRIYRTFGIDNEARLPRQCISDFRRIAIALDTWRADWEEKFTFNRHVGNYPRKGVGLHYNFAKLYLCSHAYRGLLNTQYSHVDLNDGLEEFASSAVTAAESILTVIVSDKEIQSHLNGLPTYFDTMIAFSVVFLLKAVTRSPESVRTDKPRISDILQEVSTVLVDVATQMRHEHILWSIANCTRKLVEKARSSHLNAHGAQEQNLLEGEAAFTNNELTWLTSPDDSIFVGNFDLTGSIQDMDFNFMDFAPTS